MVTIPPRKDLEDNNYNDLYIVVIKLDGKVQNINSLLMELKELISDLAKESKQTLIRLQVVETRINESDWWDKNKLMLWLMAIPVILSIFGLFNSFSNASSIYTEQQIQKEIIDELKQIKEDRENSGDNKNG